MKDDASEQKNLANQFPEITSKSQNKLKIWLVTVNAKYPKKDLEFDAGKRAGYDKNIIEKRLPKLEKLRLNKRYNIIKNEIQKFTCFNNSNHI